MNKKFILLVEDNPSDIELTKRAFSRGHISNELIVVTDGQQALEFLFGTGKFSNRNIRELPTLTLLDINLPKFDGLEVLRQIRENETTRRMPVVMLTSSDEERDIATSYDLGVNSYIRKPVDFNQFVDSILQLGLYWLVINEPPPVD